jgi:hypothetical protein
MKFFIVKFFKLVISMLGMFWILKFIISYYQKFITIKLEKVISVWDLKFWRSLVKDSKSSWVCHF